MRAHRGIVWVPIILSKYSCKFLDEECSASRRRHGVEPSATTGRRLRAWPEKHEPSYSRTCSKISKRRCSLRCEQMHSLFLRQPTRAQRLAHRSPGTMSGYSR